MISFVLVALLSVCPTVADLERYAAQMGHHDSPIHEVPIVFQIPDGCPLPVRGLYLYTEQAALNDERDKAELSILRDRIVAEVNACVEKRDAIIEQCKRDLLDAASSNDLIQRRLLEIERPPSRLLWAGIGAAATIAALVVINILQ